MAFNTKLIYCETKNQFQKQLDAEQITDTSIVFIKSTGELWTHGKLFAGNFVSKDSNKIALTLGGSSVELSKAGHTHSYLPLSGGTLTGALNFANNTWNKLGDDAYIGDHNVGNHLCIKAISGTTAGIAFFNSSDGAIGKLASANNTLQWNGTNISLSNHNHDDRYVNITGDTMTGNLSINKANPTIYLTSGWKEYSKIEFNHGTYQNEDWIGGIVSSSFGSAKLVGKDTGTGELSGNTHGMGFINARSNIGGWHFINKNKEVFYVHYTGDVKANGYIKNNSSDSYVLLGGGGHKQISDFALTSSLSNYVTLTSAQTISGIKTFSSQQKFTVANGTSPFTVSSSTVVTNLNSDMLDNLHGSSYMRCDGTNGISLTGGNGNTAGWRLVLEKTCGGWTICDIVIAITSRHSGQGILSIGFHTTNDSGTTYSYNIQFKGSTTGISSPSWRAFYNTSTKKFRLFWNYFDHSGTQINVISRNGFDVPKNGTWYETLPSDNGTELTILYNVAQRLGTTTIGNATTPIYLNSGTPTACSVSISGNANTIAVRDGSGDLQCRLVRPTYANQTTISGALAYRVNNSSDNYIRFCSDTAAIRTWLGVSSSNHSHTVFKNNVMIKGTNGMSDSASIHLGIGDSDTGFKWISDGVVQMYSNNVAIGQWNASGMNWLKQPMVNGSKIWHAGNDGPNSGMNADLLDGLHAGSFMRGTWSSFSYFGMANSSGSDTDWIRTTKYGIIPYESGVSSALGTEQWRFETAYINSIYGNLNGYASSAGVLHLEGEAGSSTGTSLPSNVGMQLYQYYNSGNGPTTYGNFLRIRGNNGGCGELFLGWQGDNNTSGIWYKSKRDVGSWGAWRTVAFTDSNVASADQAIVAEYLSPHYAGGVQTNPQTYFSNSTGVKVAMTGVGGMGSYWTDTLWINGYSGGDVKGMCALHFSKQNGPRFSISYQNHDNSFYGTCYEVWTSYNFNPSSVVSDNIKWAMYKVTIGSSSASYSKMSGNHNFISGSSRLGTGSAALSLSYPSGASKTSIMMSATGHHAGSDWNRIVYASLQPDYGSSNQIKLMLGDDSTNNDGEAIITFMYVG